LEWHRLGRRRRRHRRHRREHRFGAREPFGRIGGQRALDGADVGTVAIAASIASALANRSAGSVASARSTAPTNSRERSGRRSSSGRWAPATTASAIATEPSPRNGRSPAAAS
jgi:hypothetical protein